MTRYLELELLGPLSTLEPGSSVALIEHWEILPADAGTDDATLRALAERIGSGDRRGASRDRRASAPADDHGLRVTRPIEGSSAGARSPAPPPAGVGSARDTSPGVPCDFRRSGGPRPLDEPADPPEGLLEPLVRGRVAHPHVAGAGWPEGVARDDRHVLLGQQPLGEGLGA